MQLHPGYHEPSPGNELLCSRCSKPATDPVMSKCGHKHCRACLWDALVCAACGLPLEQQCIQELDWAQWRAHALIRVQCRCCSLFVPHGLWSEHVQACPIFCLKCKGVVSRATTANHVKGDCLVNPHRGYEQPDLSDQQELLCSHCCKFAVSPIVPFCGHTHCADCAEARPTCAQCLVPWTSEEWQSIDSPRHLALRKAYDAVLVQCRGCKAKVPRGHDGAAFAQHTELCPLTCARCLQQVTRATLSQHLEQECIHTRVHCKAAPFCEWNNSRHLLKSHEQTCSTLAVLPALQRQQVEIEKLTEQLNRQQVLTNYVVRELIGVVRRGKEFDTATTSTLNMLFKLVDP